MPKPMEGNFAYGNTLTLTAFMKPCRGAIAPPVVKEHPPGTHCSSSHIITGYATPFCPFLPGRNIKNRLVSPHRDCCNTLKINRLIYWNRRKQSQQRFSSSPLSVIAEMEQEPDGARLRLLTELNRSAARYFAYLSRNCPDARQTPQRRPIHGKRQTLPDDRGEALPTA
jgi:hypothetical protein